MLRVTVTGDESFPEGSEASARVTRPDLTASDLRLERVGGDTFVGEMPVDAAGTYAVGSSVVDAAGAQVGGGTALANVSYSAEYQPGEPDRALLARVSEVTGGRGEIDPGAAFDPDDLRAGRSRLSLAGWFLLAAALLWPVAIALSRLALAGSPARSVAHAGTASLAWLRARAPGRPGGGRERGARRARDPAPDERVRAREPAPDEPAAAPAESLGALLAAQRRRRGAADGGEDEATGGDGAEG